ncbi:Alanine--tRNA ligase [Buchnera aphidicola (Eriosoma lanigerum)]|uniref:alanine--tRNA ligase n=1 Tax=Buchnera aphidicola TaxID=9 RepID=UPI003463989C
MNITTNQIRTMFLSFFKKKDHKIIPSSSLIPNNDPSLLFTNAGMNQFKEIFLGNNKPKFSKVVTIQKCLRTGGKYNDLDNIGYSDNHHTFFEMLGNFSFGDYFKKEAISYAWELLTSIQWFNLNKNRLWVTVYYKDQETYQIWINIIGLNPERVIYVGNKKNSNSLSDNFWSMGENGPCGPSTEIFYDPTENFLQHSGEYFKNNQDTQIEIWNIVFMEYNRTLDGELIPLPNKSVDTGMGLERISRILQNKKSNYEIDIFDQLIKSIFQFNKNIYSNKKKSIYIIADHIRSSAFLIAENIFPSNEGRGYVLRRIIRRALRHAHTSGMNKLFFFKLIPTLIEVMGEESNLIKNNIKKVQEVLKQEEIQFNYTIHRGIKLLEDQIKKLKGNILHGKIIFKLYDTFGFPVDLTADFCKEQNLQIDSIGFMKEMNKQKKQTKIANQFAKQYDPVLTIKNHSIFKGYNTYETTSIIKQIFINGKTTNQLNCGESGIIILDNTPFYPESGGQIGDIGEINNKQNIFKVENTKKYGIGIIHFGKILSGKLSVNQEIQAKINIKYRKNIQNNHSATHLLHSALRNIFGNNTIQKGSLITNLSLRFDFSCNEKITNEKIHKIEYIVNEYIIQNSIINTTIDTFNNAQKTGAIALFNEKYNDIVRIVSINDYSIELCGGTHTNQTGSIGFFKIINEKSIGSGIKRIEAVTGNKAILFIHNKETKLNHIMNILNTNEDNISKKIHVLTNTIHKLKNNIDIFIKRELIEITKQLLKKVIHINNINLLIENINISNSNLLRNVIDIIQKKLHSAIIIITTIIEKKIYFIIKISKNLTNDIQANYIAKKIINNIGGKGGGKSHLSEGGGGTKVELLSITLNNIQSWIKKKFELL